MPQTEVIYFTSRFQNTQQLLHVQINGNGVGVSKPVRDLGVMLDNKLQMDQHICNVCRIASYGIYKIGRLRRYLDHAELH